MHQHGEGELIVVWGVSPSHTVQTKCAPRQVPQRGTLGPLHWDSAGLSKRAGFYPTA